MRRITLGDNYLESLTKGSETHLPTDLDALLKAARGARAPSDYGEEYVQIAAHFDHAYYFGRNPDVARARLDPVAHYIRAGAATGRDPTPHFSGASYVKQVPEAQQSGLTPFGHFLRHAPPEDAPLYATSIDFPALSRVFGQAPSELLSHLNDRHENLRTRLVTGKLGAVANKAAELEPLIARVWNEALSPRLLPFTNEGVLSRILALHDLEHAAHWRRARIVLVTAQASGDMEARTAALAAALAQHIPCEDIVILRLLPTPFDDALWGGPAFKGMRLITMPKIDLHQDARWRVLVEFLRALRPDTCLLEASGAGSNDIWDLLDAYGRQLSTAMSLVLWLPDATADTANAELSAKFYRHFDQLAALWAPSDKLLEDLTRRFCLSDTEAAQLAALPTSFLDGSLQTDTDKPLKVAGVSSGINAVETDRFVAVAQKMPNIRFVLLLETVAKQRRYKYFPNNLEVFHVSEADCTDAIRIWLDCGGSGAWTALMAARGVAIVANAQTCANLDSALTWCPPDNSIDALAHTLGVALDGHDGKAANSGSEKATQPKLGQMLKRLSPPKPWAHISNTQPSSKEADTLLTVALTAHGERHVAGPMLHSVRRAIDNLKRNRTEATIEVLLGFDTPSPDCVRFFENAIPNQFPECRMLHFAFRDQGQTRNALAAEARGRFLAFVDADDLISENWLDAAVGLLETAQGDSIVHPEVNWQFDGVQRIYSNPAQDDPLFSPYVMAIANYYDAMCVAPTRLWQALPYASRDLAAGFALEDYQWFVEATALGWKHLLASDTIVFKRRRDRSQHSDSRQARALIRAIPALAIDQLHRLGRDA